MPSSEDKSETLMGFVALAILGYVLYLLVSWTYHRFVPVPSISLATSAWFEPPASGGARQLRVAGDVLEGGKPATQDRLRLSVEDWTKGIRQSVFLDVKNGHFDSDEQPAFRSFVPHDRLHIRAEYVKGGTSATEEVYLGVRVPHVNMRTALIILGVIAFGSLGFLWLFTGPPRPGKNTGAIIMSYLIMVVFLGVPLVLPSVVSVVSPDIIAIMRETPVGVLIADPKKGDLGRQWVLNIGGSVVIDSQAATFPPPPTEAQPSAPQGQTPAASRAMQAGETSPTSAAAPPPASSKPPAQLTTTAQTPAAAPSDAAKLASMDDSMVAIQGGLVIPLYVLILSLIGGAINMTLKLPDFQREAVGLELSPRRAAAQAFSATAQALSAAVDQLKNVGGKVGSAEQGPQGAAETPTAGQAESAVTSQAPPAPTPTTGQTEGAVTSQAPRTPTETAEELLLRQTSEWRKGLITQHMYLLSAPFLAIAVYYLLVWLDLLRQPALVLVSFSVGLISDKIVGRITGVASGIVEAARPERKTSVTES